MLFCLIEASEQFLTPKLSQKVDPLWMNENIMFLTLIQHGDSNNWKLLNTLLFQPRFMLPSNPLVWFQSFHNKTALSSSSSSCSFINHHLYHSISLIDTIAAQISDWPNWEKNLKSSGFFFSLIVAGFAGGPVGNSRWFCDLTSALLSMDLVLALAVLERFLCQFVEFGYDISF